MYIYFKIYILLEQDDAFLTYSLSKEATLRLGIGLSIISMIEYVGLQRYDVSW